MSKDFELFKKEFKYWQERFGLLDWKVYFRHEPLDDMFACLVRQRNGRVATATISNKIDKYNKDLVDPKGSAKHEALHLLLSDFYLAAVERYISSETELEREEEKVVVKLMEIIK